MSNMILSTIAYLTLVIVGILMKLLGIIELSWFIILSPLWAAPLFLGLVLIGWLILVLISHVEHKNHKRKKNKDV